MSLRNIGIVYRKELTESLRDRRTLISTIVVPLLLFPVLTVGFGYMAANLIGKAQKETHRVMILGGEDHDSVGFLLRLPNEVCRHIAEADGEHGEKKQRHDDGGDEGAAVAQRFGEFLAIDDADIAQAHGQSFSAET